MGISRRQRAVVREPFYHDRGGSGQYCLEHSVVQGVGHIRNYSRYRNIRFHNQLFLLPEDTVQVLFQKRKTERVLERSSVLCDDNALDCGDKLGCL